MTQKLLFLLLMVCFVSNLSGHGFGAATPVKRDTIRQPIEHLVQYFSSKNISVSSYDFNTGAILNSSIKSRGESKTNCYFQIGFDENPRNDILCTPSQEFYDVNAQQWTPVLQLCIGDELLSAHGKCAIASIQFIKAPLKVYTLEIKHTHNFFIGSYAILTHNMLLPWVLSAGIGVSFGAGAAAGGTAGGCFGPITLVGGAVIGGIICAGIKMLTDGNRLQYALHFDTDAIEDHFKTNILYEDKSDDAQAPGKPNENDGFTPKKNWDRKKVRHPRGWGYPDNKGRIWIPTGQGGSAHGGPHWDVQYPGKNKDYDNVFPGGVVRKCKK